MKKQYTISLFSANKTGLITRIVAAFARRQINIKNINISGSETHGVYHFTILVHEKGETVTRLTQQLEKQIDVFQVFYQCQDHQLFQNKAS